MKPANFMFPVSHNSKLTIPWFLFSIGVALFLLLLLPLLFLRKKVQDIGILKDHILQMSGGDLHQPIRPMGNDELGILARELDQMRSTLYTNIQQETESRRAIRISSPPCPTTCAHR